MPPVYQPGSIFERPWHTARTTGRSRRRTRGTTLPAALSCPAQAAARMKYAQSPPSRNRWALPLVGTSLTGAGPRRLRREQGVCLACAVLAHVHPRRGAGEAGADHRAAAGARPTERRGRRDRRAGARAGSAPTIIGIGRQLGGMRRFRSMGELAAGMFGRLLPLRERRPRACGTIDDTRGASGCGSVPSRRPAR